MAVSIFVGLASLSDEARTGTLIHGGSVIACGTSSDPTKTVQLLDLFEAEARGAQLIPSQTTTDEALKFVQDRVENAMGDEWFFAKVLHDGIPAVKQLMRLTWEIDRIGDEAHVPRLPAGCRVEQLAVFDFAGVISVKEALWRKLSSRDRAALWLHELVFSLQRRIHGSETYGGDYIHSIQTRELVGALFDTRLSNTELAREIRKMTLGFSNDTYSTRSGAFSVRFEWDAPTRRALMIKTARPGYVCGHSGQLEESGIDELTFRVREGRLVASDFRAFAHPFRSREDRFVADLQTHCGLLPVHPRLVPTSALNNFSI